MKFLPSGQRKTMSQEFSGVGKVEQYIELTKNNLDDNLPLITKRTTSNLTAKDKATINKLMHMKMEITIKPADKFGNGDIEYR